MQSMLRGKLKSLANQRHIWWGVSVENQSQGVPRIELLRQAHVSMPFLSIEPLLEDLGELDLSEMAWVIVGGESGPGARPLRKAWVRKIRAQCRSFGAPFFFKQWGGVRKHESGRELDGRTYDEFPVGQPAAPPPMRRARLNVIESIEHCLPSFLGQLAPW